MDNSLDNPVAVKSGTFDRFGQRQTEASQLRWQHCKCQILQLMRIGRHVIHLNEMLHIQDRDDQSSKFIWITNVPTSLSSNSQYIKLSYWLNSRRHAYVLFLESWQWQLNWRWHPCGKWIVYSGIFIQLNIAVKLQPSHPTVSSHTTD